MKNFNLQTLQTCRVAVAEIEVLYVRLLKAFKPLRFIIDLSNPLFNPITIFNTHNNSNFTTLITNNHTNYYYDSLNLRPPPAINMIHNTLRQWYSGLEVAPPLLRQDTPITHNQSTPQQTYGWTCGLHMLLINLTTIYQGRIRTLTLKFQNETYTQPTRTSRVPSEEWTTEYSSNSRMNMDSKIPTL